MLPEARSPQGKLATALLSNTWQHTECAAHMQEATQQPTILSAADPIAAAAFRAEAWAGEPFLRDGEDPAVSLAPGTARRRALDDATAEIDAGRPPTPQWKVRYALMLGLERVLADPEPHTAAGTPLRRHQNDALAGMLTELIAAVQRDDEALANGNGHGLATDELAEVEDDEDLALLEALPHQSLIAAGAERQREGVEQDRLAGAGLAGQHREAVVELDIQRSDDHEVAQGKAAQHFTLSAGPPQGGRAPPRGAATRRSR